MFYTTLTWRKNISMIHNKMHKYRFYFIFLFLTHFVLFFFSYSAECWKAGLKVNSYPIIYWIGVMQYSVSELKMRIDLFKGLLELTVYISFRKFILSFLHRTWIVYTAVNHPPQSTTAFKQFLSTECFRAEGPCPVDCFLLSPNIN